MDKSQDKVADHEYSDELKELSQSREIICQDIQEPLEDHYIFIISQLWLTSHL